MFNVDIEVIYATPVSCVQDILASILMLITQLNFARRLYTVCGGPTSITSRMVTLAVCFFAFITFVFSLTSVVQIFQHGDLTAMASPSMAIVAVISQGFAAAANMIISIAMCWSLRPTRYPDMVMPAGVLENVIAVCISRGLVLTVVQLACIGAVGGYPRSRPYITSSIQFIASPTKPYWIALQMITCRVCVNTLLGLLNVRGARRGVGFNAEETLSYRNDSSNNHDGLPSLRFRRPTNTKATQQTITFSRQEMDSGAIDIDETSKPSEHDENMSSPRSQYSEQPEGKTRLSSELEI
ncbi:hypothetical protein K503DRAFT_858324 [Rhizopogon vinicolor AM-OR11-026]|uniref:DUF6534 domain-containing protein n=1 Tax=Rhizopogon vinicolor AM-OR11-026 TaxID=1314800 RepID=A0A1B7MTF6_9AGAM|nr:hypothetical protein K503DRAFT_858324 [Rhizopogon vinicolor AM-OR11-026]